MAILVIGLSSSAFAQQHAQPEEKSPCTFDLDADWLVPLKSTSAKTVSTKVRHTINCEGAVIKSITATGKDATTTLQFTVGYKPGHDRVGIISFSVLDDDKRAVGVGEAAGNLVQGADSSLSGTMKIKSREFDRVFATGNSPVIRIELGLQKD
jgi:hypothetical protein